MNDQSSGLRRRSPFIKLFYISELTAAFILLLMCVAMTLLSEYFLTLTNIMNVLRQVSIICIIAIGQQMLLATACVDLTVGIGMGFTGVVCAKLFMAGIPAIPAFVLTLLCGMAVGALNGFIVTTFRTIPFITTMATMSLVRGAASLLCDTRPIRFDTPLNFLGSGYIAEIVPVSVAVMAVLVVFGHIFSKRTTIGRNLYAVGNNDKSAALSGINVAKTRMIAYMITGMLVAISGIIIAGNIMNADPMTGFNMELEVVVACVIGGASLFGGAGTIIGVLIGSTLMGVLKNGFVLLGVAQYWQTIVIGVIVILLVYVDVLRKRGAGEKE